MIVDAGAGNDTIRGGRGNDDLSGGDGNDFITGGDGDDFLRGNFGNDTLHGHDGNDRLSGNQGNDTIYGHDGNDEINGGLGNDRAWGGSGDDFVGGNEGHDELRGDSGIDILRGGDGDDYLHGGSDNDRLFGDAGADELWGSSGVDLFFADDADDVRDRSGNETIETEPPGTASIGDLVFIDADGDGVFDTGETGLEGAVVKLFNGSDEIASQTTGSDGLYSFSALEAGDYRVELAAESIFDYEITTAASVDVTLADGEMNSAIDFGAQELPPGTASIGDLVFEDLNENGTFDAGEPGVAGIVIHLLRSGVQVSTQTTDADGQYAFDGLRAGSYEVVLNDGTLPSGTAVDNASVAVAVGDGEQNSDIDFAVVERENTVDLAALLLPFGAGLTNSVSSIVFNGLLGDASNVTSVGNVTFVDTSKNRIVFRTDIAEGGLTDVGQVRMVGTLPMGLPNEVAFQLSNAVDQGETLHIVGLDSGPAPIVALDGVGLGRNVGRVNLQDEVTFFGELAPDPIEASALPVVSSIVAGVRVPILNPVFGVSVPDTGIDDNSGVLLSSGILKVPGTGVNEPDATELIQLNDGRNLQITTNTGVALEAAFANRRVSKSNAIEFEISPSDGNINNVHLLQFVNLVRRDAQGQEVNERVPVTGVTTNNGQNLNNTEKIIRKTNEYYLDTKVFTPSSFYDLSQNSNVRTKDSLTLWDVPFSPVQPDSTDLIRQEFYSYVVVENKIVYEIKWQMVFENSGDQVADTTGRYESVVGRATSTLAPEFNTLNWQTGTFESNSGSLGQSFSKPNPFFTETGPLTPLP